MHKSGWVRRRNAARTGVMFAIVVMMCATPGAAPALAAPAGPAARTGPAVPPPQGSAAQALRGKHDLGRPAATTFVPAHPAAAGQVTRQSNPVAQPAPAARWPQAATSTVALAATGRVRWPPVPSRGWPPAVRP